MNEQLMTTIGIIVVQVVAILYLLLLKYYNGKE